MGSNLVSSFKQKGASIVEALIALPIALGVILGSWQAARLYETKVTLDHASVTAARSGALHNADVNAIKLGLARGLIPLYATGNSDGAVINALAKISENLVTNSSVRILNPTKEAFTDFAENVKGIRQIPNEDLYKRSTAIGKTSKINIQDANLLSIHIIYAVKPEAPFIGPAISSIVRSPLFISAVDNDLKPFYLRGLIPITSSTIVRMQTPARQNGAMLSNNDLNVDRSLTGTKERLVPADLTPINPPEDNNNSNNNSGNGNDQDSSDSSADGSHNSNDGSNSSGNNSNNNTDDQANLTDQDSSADEVECTTKWSDERYAAQECGDGFWCKYVGEWTSQVKRAANVVMDFVGGLMEGMKDQIQGLWDLLQDPSVLLDVAKAFIEDPEGTLKKILEGVVDDIEKVLSCGPTDIGKVIGQNVDPAVFLKVAQKLAKVVGNDSLIKYAEKVEADTKKLDEDNTISCSSFPAGTLISTPLGSKPIESIQLGDIVNSRDESTFLNTKNRVMALFNREAPDYQHITTETGIINATPEHPFWVQGQGWVQAQNITVEDVVASAHGDVLILKNEHIAQPIHVYNFSVAKTPSYFAGYIDIWVHNSSGKCKTSIVGDSKILRDNLDPEGHYSKTQGTWAAHHLITSAQAKYSSALKAAVEKGIYDQNWASNGIMLPNQVGAIPPTGIIVPDELPLHISGHTGTGTGLGDESYQQYVKNKLDKLDDEYLDNMNTWSDTDLSQAILKVQEEIRSDLLSGKVVLCKDKCAPTIWKQ